MAKEIKKEIEITNNNYNGYLSLYNYKKNPYNDEFELNLFNKVLKSFLKFIGALTLSVCFMNANNILVLVPVFIFSYSVGITLFIKKQYSDFYQKNISKILEEYPNIENIRCDYLSKSFEKNRNVKQLENEFKLDINKKEEDLTINKVLVLNKFENAELTINNTILSEQACKVKTKTYRRKK